MLLYCMLQHLLCKRCFEIYRNAVKSYKIYVFEPSFLTRHFFVGGKLLNTLGQEKLNPA